MWPEEEVWLRGEVWLEEDLWIGEEAWLEGDVEVRNLEGMQRPEGKGMAARVGKTEGATSASYCQEPYANPPTKDWLQFQECQEWFHEACGNGFNVCDLCDG